MIKAPIDRARFFADVRARFGALKVSQVEGFGVLLDGFEGEQSLPLTHAAYMLATAWHETARTMQPVRETLANSDEQVIQRLDHAFRAGKLQTVGCPYWRPDARGRAWFGRGYVQLTHRENYEKLGEALGVNLTSRPELALLPAIAYRILSVGMRDGLFTGKSLGDYLTARATDYRGARAIINGRDQARTIAGYAEQFEQFLTDARA